MPTKAIREMVANAVVHRSYLDEACVQVCIFDDRIEVLSPGMLYGGLDIATAKMGKSRCRNEAIAEAFHYMHIIESWGTGIPRLYNRCAEYGLSEPLFEEFGDGIKVTMFRKVSNAQEKVSNATKNMCNTLKEVSNAAGKVINNAQKVSNTFEKYMPLFREAEITDKFIKNIEQVFCACGTGVPFGQANVQEWLNCSKSKATNVMNAMKAAKDDKEGEVVGVADGSVEAVVWSEKAFADNEPTLSSNAHVLFIGDTKLSKSQRGGLAVKYDDFGLKYGWLGKRAVMYVDRVISNVVEYNRFFEFAVNYQENFTKAIERKTVANIVAGEEIEMDEKDYKVLHNSGNGKARTALAAIVSPVVAVVAIPVAASKGVANLKERKNVLQQQWSCLTMLFYLEGLNEFLEGFTEGYKFFESMAGYTAGAQIGDQYIQNINHEIDELVKNLNSFQGFATQSAQLKGDIAEFWHAGTFNIDAVIKGSGHRATVERSHEFASVDISTNFGKDYGSKYYRTAQESAKAQAKIYQECYKEYQGKGGTGTYEEFLQERGKAYVDPNSPIYAE